MEKSGLNGGLAPWKNVLGIVFVVALVLGALWLAKGGGGAAEDTSTIVLKSPAEEAPDVGAVAPLIEAETVTGEALTIPSAGSKPTWLVFNATWCANCRAEMPDIETMFSEYSDRVDFASIYVGDSANDVEAYGTKLGLTFPLVPDPESKIGALYRTLGVPAHYFIGVDGKVVSLHVGALSEASMRERLNQLLPHSD
jgi:Thiol-disulfide isomerase and thioredoxins